MNGAESPVEPAPTERFPFWGYADLLFFAGMTVPSLLLGAFIVRCVVALGGWSVRSRVVELRPAVLAITELDTPACELELDCAVGHRAGLRGGLRGESAENSGYRQPHEATAFLAPSYLPYRNLRHDARPAFRGARVSRIFAAAAGAQFRGRSRHSNCSRRVRCPASAGVRLLMAPRPVNYRRRSGLRLDAPPNRLHVRFHSHALGLQSHLLHRSGSPT